MPSTAVLVIGAWALAQALTAPRQPVRHTLRPVHAALVETAGLVPAGARHVSEDLVGKTHCFDIDLKEPLKCMNDNFEHWERENAKFAAEAAKEEEEATKAMVEGEEEEEGEEKD